MSNKEWIDGVWNTDLYQKRKIENFNIADAFIKKHPSVIIDIGCGLAWESRLFNKKYGCELYLIDGDTSANEYKPVGSTTGSYHQSSDDFLFYHQLDKLDYELKQLGTKNFYLINCNQINIPDTVKADIITSWLSCGFHYPVETYKDLCLKHAHKDTVIIMDIRIRKGNLHYNKEMVEILEILNTREKYSTCVIKFKEIM